MVADYQVRAISIEIIEGILAVSERRDLGRWIGLREKVTNDKAQIVLILGNEEADEARTIRDYRNENVWCHKVRMMV